MRGFRMTEIQWHWCSSLGEYRDGKRSLDRRGTKSRRRRCFDKCQRSRKICAPRPTVDMVGRIIAERMRLSLGQEHNAMSPASYHPRLAAPHPAIRHRGNTDCSFCARRGWTLIRSLTIHCTWGTLPALYATNLNLACSLLQSADCNLLVGIFTLAEVYCCAWARVGRIFALVLTPR